VKIDHSVYSLRLRQPFRTARSAADAERHVVIVRVDGGVGEAAPTPYYGETVETVRHALERYAPVLADLPPIAPIETASARMRAALGGNTAARAAVECALWDALGRWVNQPLWRLWGLDPTHVPQTSYTIGLDTLDAMQAKAREAEPYAILKVKVGGSNDLDVLRALRDVTDKPIRVDANTAWTAREAVERCEELAPFGVEFVEQPVKAHDLDGLRFVRERSPVPIVADESARTSMDIPRLAGCVDGINIKLAKCGGLIEAMSMIRAARAHSMRVMVGCMIESSVGIASMAQLTPLVDYVDLDGHLLVANDPYEGARCVAGRIALTEASGTGARFRSGT